MQKKYSISIALVVNGVLQDKLQEAHHFQVISGDYYKTGKIPPIQGGKFLADYEFSISE